MISKRNDKINLVYVTNVFDQTQKDLFDALSNSNYFSFKLIIMPKNGYIPTKTRIINSASYSIVYSENKKQCIKLLKESEVLILTTQSFNKFRKYFNKKRVIIKVGEKFYKHPPINLFEKIKRRFGIFVHYRIFEKYKPLYFGIGSFVEEDFKKYKVFSKRCYQFAYFSSMKSHFSCNTNSLKRPIRICWIGRMVEWKNPIEVINMAKFCKHNNLDVTFTMYSCKNKLFDFVENEIKQNEIQNFLFLKNQILGNKVFDEIKKYDFSLVTSGREEGWGLTTQDSLSQGVPVIANNLSGATKLLVIDNYNGFVYNSSCEWELILKRISIINNEKYRILCNNSLEYIKKVLDVDLVPVRLFQLINSIRTEKKYSLFDDGLLKNIF